jgi:diamine N-acetyltransferase
VVAAPRVELVPAGEADLPVILAAEAQARADGFVQGWDEATHRMALNAPDTAYRMIRESGAAVPVGYAILRGLADANRAVELKRFVITARGRGLGRAAFRALLRFAFDQAGAHRFWLDVFTDNPRARHLYRSEGLCEEGVMRECVLRNDGWASLVLMSMLESEFHRDAPPRSD